MADKEPEALKMKRDIGLTGGVALVSGSMIGSGIFMSPQFVLAYVGSPGASLVIWALSGAVAMFGALSYTELGTIIPESGGDFIYILRICGSCPAFFAAFSSVLLVKPLSIAAMAISIAEYAMAPFYSGCQPPELALKCAAAVTILVAAIINILNVRIAIRIQVVFLVAKVVALVVIIVGGIVAITQSSSVTVENLKVENAFKGTRYSWNTFGMAFYQGLWSYAGWVNLNYVTEELKKPEVRIWMCIGRNEDKEPENLKMKRDIGLTGGVALLSGSMIGSGIFMSPQFVLAYVGSPGASLVIWALSGAVAMFGALSYTELGTVIPESGGDFIYILRICGSCPAFFAAFSSVLLVKPLGIAALAISIAEYVMAPFYSGCQPPELALKCAAAVTILVAAIINILNVRIAIRIQVVFMMAQMVALAVIIVGGIVAITQSSSMIVENLKVENAFKGTRRSWNTFGMALYQGLWSYGGWATLNCVTEELKKPEVNLPRAVVIAISLVTGLYLLVNVSYLTVMTPKELMTSNAVAVTWGNKVLGSWGWIMSVAAALSAFGSLNGTFFSGGRVCFVAAREGHMPDILAMAHVHRLTPSPALIFTTVVSLVVLIPGDFQSIVNFFSFTAWFFYAITLSGLLYLKIKKPELPRPYRVPIILPIVVLIAAIFLVLAPIIDNPQIEYLYVSLFILSGVLVYIPFIHYKLCPGLLTKLTVFLQLFLEVAPAEKNL